jgi:hypothetical protein
MLCWQARLATATRFINLWAPTPRRAIVTFTWHDTSMYIWYKYVVVSLTQSTAAWHFPMNVSRTIIPQISYLFISCFWNQVAGRIANVKGPHRTYTTPCKFRVWSSELSNRNASRVGHVLCFRITEWLDLPPYKITKHLAALATSTFVLLMSELNSKAKSAVQWHGGVTSGPWVQKPGEPS